MNRSSEIREYLVSRRARITPDRAGLPTYGGRRRVKGLRREEAALLPLAGGTLVPVRSRCPEPDAITLEAFGREIPEA